jgi:hypothetical protein
METVPLQVVLPQGGEVSGMTATEGGEKYVPAELCPVCYVPVPQLYAADHAATHPAPPPTAQPV